MLLADGEATRFPAAEPSAPVLDSNGAGDAFAAAFLYGPLRGEPPRHCARIWARASAIGPWALLAGVAASGPGTVSGA